MLRRRIKVKLSLQERKKLEQIASSNTISVHTQIKVKVLLLTDEGNFGPAISSKNVATELDIGSRTIVRIRQAYADKGIASFVDTSLPKSANSEEMCSKEILKKSKRNHTEPEIELADCLPSNQAKYRVIITEEERAYLTSIISKGRHSNRKITRAKILLCADESIQGLAMTDKEISIKLDVSLSTIERVRKLFVGVGKIEEVLCSNHHKAGRYPKIDGDMEALLIATVCSSPPKGRCKWTLRLLADKLVELTSIDSISHVCVRNTLKKTNLSLGEKSNG